MDFPAILPASSGSEITVSLLIDDTGLPHPLLTVYVMLVVPALTAVASPAPAVTAATAVFVLLQLPPDVPSLLYVAVAPMQSNEVPLTLPGVTPGSTVRV